MSTVLLIILLIISVIMTGLILIQQSEGGALGIGGGGGGGFMSGRSAANSVSRMTGILGGVFLVTCLALSVLMTRDAAGPNLLEQAGEVSAEDTASENSTENSPVSSDEALTNQADSDETTIPLESVTEAVETGENPTESAKETPAEPAETPEDE